MASTIASSSTPRALSAAPIARLLWVPRLCATTPFAKRVSERSPRATSSSSTRSTSAASASLLATSFARSSAREYSRRASSVTARAFRGFAGLFVVVRRLAARPQSAGNRHAYRSANLRFDLGRDFRMIAEKFTRVVLPLADLLAVVRVPGAGLFDDVVRDTELD